jgi:hypothetical protein
VPGERRLHGEVDRGVAVTASRAGRDPRDRNSRDRDSHGRDSHGRDSHGRDSASRDTSDRETSDGETLEGETSSRVADLASAILAVVSVVPSSDEPHAADPSARARALAAAASRRAAAVSAVAALPPGPIGWLTLLPEAAAIWRVHTRLVADIAAAHGRSDALTRELMLHVLFAHAAGRPLGGLVVRMGERLLVRTASYRALQPIARTIALRLSRRTVARGAARFVPGVGSAAVAVFAWRETGRVAQAAIEVFSRPIDVAPGD